MVRQMIVFIILVHLVCVLLTESTHLYLMHNRSIEDTGPFIAPSPHVISNTYTPSHHNTSHENISQTRLPRPTIITSLIMMHHLSSQLITFMATFSTRHQWKWKYIWALEMLICQSRLRVSTNHSFCSS